MSGRIEDRLKELNRLPDGELPAALERRTLAAMAEASTRRGARHFTRAAASIGVIAATALIALFALDLEEPADAPETAAVDAPDAPETAAADALYYDLLAESALLEELLDELPPPRRVMRVSTAGTIVGLEERIALIDAALDRADAGSGPPEFRTALMRDRVDVMHALVNVRYAQSRAFNY